MFIDNKQFGMYATIKTHYIKRDRLTFLVQLLEQTFLNPIQHGKLGRLKKIKKGLEKKGFEFMLLTCLMRQAFLVVDLGSLR